MARVLLDIRIGIVLKEVLGFNIRSTEKSKFRLLPVFCYEYLSDIVSDDDIEKKTKRQRNRHRLSPTPKPFLSAAVTTATLNIKLRLRFGWDQLTKVLNVRF